MLISFEYMGFSQHAVLCSTSKRRHNLFVFRLAWIILTFYHNDIRICNYSGIIMMFHLHTAVFFSFFANFSRIINFQNLQMSPNPANTNNVMNLPLKVIEVC